MQVSWWVAQYVQNWTKWLYYCDWCHDALYCMLPLTSQELYLSGTWQKTPIIHMFDVSVRTVILSALNPYMRNTIMMYIITSREIAKPRKPAEHMSPNSHHSAIHWPSRWRQHVFGPPLLFWVRIFRIRRPNKCSTVKGTVLEYLLGAAHGGHIFIESTMYARSQARKCDSKRRSDYYYYVLDVIFGTGREYTCTSKPTSSHQPSTRQHKSMWKRIHLYRIQKMPHYRQSTNLPFPTTNKIPRVKAQYNP